MKKEWGEKENVKSEIAQNVDEWVWAIKWNINWWELGEIDGEDKLFSTSTCGGFAILYEEPHILYVIY